MTMDRGTADRIAQGLGWFSIGLGAAEILAPRQLSNLIGVRDNDARAKIMRTYGLREIAAGVGILAQRDGRRAPWVWSRVAGDILDLSSLGAAFGSRGANRGRLAAATAAVAGVTALDLLCSAQLTNGIAGSRSVRVRRTIIIDRPADEVYRFWQDQNNLSRFMNFVESIQPLGGGRMRWKLKVPGLRAMEWDTRISSDIPGSLIAWRSEEGSEIDMSGTVRFEDAPGRRGTLVSLSIHFVPPGGAMGAAVARMLDRIPKSALEMCLHRLKQVIETGEVARSDASIHTGMHAAQPPAEVPEPVFSY